MRITFHRNLVSVTVSTQLLSSDGKHPLRPFELDCDHKTRQGKTPTKRCDRLSPRTTAKERMTDAIATQQQQQEENSRTLQGRQSTPTTTQSKRDGERTKEGATCTPPPTTTIARQRTDDDCNKTNARTNEQTNEGTKERRNEGTKE